MTMLPDSFFVIRQKHAYLVIGAESSGNRMMVKALVSAGCYGDGDVEQRLDDLDFSNTPDRIAMLRSVPHGDDIPDLRGLAKLLIEAGYQVHPILMYRKTDFVVASQKAGGHGMRDDEVWEHIQMAHHLAHDLACCLGEKLLTVVYETFVTMPQIRRWVFYQLGLPEPAMEFENANIKYGLPILSF